jgi:hypothetical protein
VSRRVIDTAVAVILFGFSAGSALLWYEVCRSWYPGPIPVSEWSPILLGIGGAVAAIGLFFRRRFFAVVGAIMMLGLALLFIPRWANGVPAIACFVVAILFLWRFALPLRAATRTI